MGYLLFVRPCEQATDLVAAGCLSLSQAQEFVRHADSALLLPLELAMTGSWPGLAIPVVE